MENEVPLKLLKCFEMSSLESLESKQFCFVHTFVYKDVSTTIIVTNLEGNFD